MDISRNVFKCTPLRNVNFSIRFFFFFFFFPEQDGFLSPPCENEERGAKDQAEKESSCDKVDKPEKAQRKMLSRGEKLHLTRAKCKFSRLLFTVLKMKFSGGSLPFLSTSYVFQHLDSHVWSWAALCSFRANAVVNISASVDLFISKIAQGISQISLNEMQRKSMGKGRNN